MRATFTLKLAGTAEEIENAIRVAEEPMLEQGIIYDEDYEALLGGDGNPIGFVIHSRKALNAVIDLLEEMNAEMIEVE